MLLDGANCTRQRIDVLPVRAAGDGESSAIMDRTTAD